MHRTFLPPVTIKNITGNQFAGSLKFHSAVCFGMINIFSYHGCPVRISAYPRIQNTGTDDSSVFIKFFVFSPTNTASTAETIRKILLTCCNKNAFYICSPHIYFFQNGKVCKFRHTSFHFLHTANAVSRAAQNRKKRDHINDCISVDPQTSRLLSAPAINHGQETAAPAKLQQPAPDCCKKCRKPHRLHLHTSVHVLSVPVSVKAGQCIITQEAATDN